MATTAILLAPSVDTVDSAIKARIATSDISGPGYADNAAYKYGYTAQLLAIALEHIGNLLDADPLPRQRDSAAAFLKDFTQPAA